MTTIVADNGAYSLRLGFSHDELPRLTVPNQVAIIRNDGRELVGDETEAEHVKHHEMLEYRRPHQRGCLLDIVTEDKVWSRALSQLRGFSSSSEAKSLVVTEAPVLPQSSQRISDELFFEKLHFDRVARIPAQACIGADVAYKAGASNMLKIIVDCGYSCSWVVPLVHVNAAFPTACKRIDVGGKLLTNLLKEELSWRNFNVMDDTFVVEKCKREICYTALEWKSERPSTLEYLLPDHVEDFQGRVVKAGESINYAKRQVMHVSQERINIPEVLFQPSRIGLDQAGLSEAVNQCIEDLPWELRDEARKCIVITGGSSTFPGFVERLSLELAQYGCSNVLDWTPHYKEAAWRGAAALANSPQFLQFSVSKKQYEEEGSYYKGKTSSALKKSKVSSEFLQNPWWSLD